MVKRDLWDDRWSVSPPRWRWDDQGDLQAWGLLGAPAKLTTAATGRGFLPRTMAEFLEGLAWHLNRGLLQLIPVNLVFPGFLDIPRIIIVIVSIIIIIAVITTTSVTAAAAAAR